MNDNGTKDALIAAGRELFAEKGFKGTTVRALASRAGVNLGAVAYHFGSKEGLYHAVVERVTAPIRERLSRNISIEGSALDAIERVIRATYAFLAENPDVPRIVLQQLMTAHPLPPAARATLQMNLDQITACIAQGQSQGTIRPGDPQLMALAFMGQPMFLAIYRRALSEAAGVDSGDPRVRQRLVDTFVAFVRGALARGGGST